MKRATLIVMLLIVSGVYSIPPNSDSRGDATVFPCVLVRYSTPIKVSGVLGIAIWNPIGNSQYIGPFFQLEPGFGGGKLSIGARYGKNRFMPVLNVGMAVCLMQTWGDPLQGVDKDNTYLGIEISAGFFVLGINGGAFYHIAGDDQDSDWIYSLGIGVGI